jgi:hypothetical protein
MDISYREKSIWGNLLGMVVAYSYYFGTLAWGGTGRIFVAVCILIVINVVYQALIAVRGKVEPKDERDIWIEGKGYKNAYFALLWGVWLWILGAMMYGLQDALRGAALSAHLAAIGNSLVVVLLASELVKVGTQLFFYRRDVSR